MFQVALAPDPCFCKNCGVQIHKDRQCIAKQGSGELYCINCRVCPSRHNLSYRYDLRDFGKGIYRSNEFNCDGCSKLVKVDRGTPVLTCPECQYDLCASCVRAFFSLEGRPLSSPVANKGPGL